MDYPQRFISTPGLERYLQTIQKNGTLAQAILLVGPEHIGKATLAKKWLFEFSCSATHQPGQPPCLDCVPCHNVQQLSPNVVQWVEETDKTISVEDIRSMHSWLQLRPFQMQVRFVVLEQAQRLSQSAAASLLKLMEEPGQAVHWLLTAPRLSDVPATIISRCMVVHLRRLADHQIKAVYPTLASHTDLINGLPGIAQQCLIDSTVLERYQILQESIQQFSKTHSYSGRATILKTIQADFDYPTILTFFERHWHTTMKLSHDHLQQYTVLKQQIQGVQHHVQPKLLSDTLVLKYSL